MVKGRDARAMLEPNNDGGTEVSGLQDLESVSLTFM